MKINKIFLGMALLLAVGFTSCEDDNLQSNQTKINEPTWAKDLYPGAEWSLASPSKYGYSADLGEKIDTLVVKNGDVSGLCLVIGGEMVHQYGKNELSYLASTRKSILSMLYGIYVDNGTIDLDKTIGELIADDVIKEDVGGLLRVGKSILRRLYLLVLGAIILHPIVVTIWLRHLRVAHSNQVHTICTATGTSMFLEPSLRG